MGLSRRQKGQKFRLLEAKTQVLPNATAEPKDRVPAMRRLLSPVNAGVSAARHVLWYISYHTAGDRQQAR
jgi:hypothetical protein